METKIFRVFRVTQPVFQDPAQDQTSQNHILHIDELMSEQSIQRCFKSRIKYLVVFTGRKLKKVTPLLPYISLFVSFEIISFLTFFSRQNQQNQSRHRSPTWPQIRPTVTQMSLHAKVTPASHQTNKRGDRGHPRLKSALEPRAAP